MTAFSLIGCVLFHLFIYICLHLCDFFNLKLRLAIIKLYLFHVATREMLLLCLGFALKLLLFGMMLFCCCCFVDLESSVL